MDSLTLVDAVIGKLNADHGTLDLTGRVRHAYPDEWDGDTYPKVAVHGAGSEETDAGTMTYGETFTVMIWGVLGSQSGLPSQAAAVATFEKVVKKALRADDSLGIGIYDQSLRFEPIVEDAYFDAGNGMSGLRATLTCKASPAGPNG